MKSGVNKQKMDGGYWPIPIQMCSIAGQRQCAVHWIGNQVWCEKTPSMIGRRFYMLFCYEAVVAITVGWILQFHPFIEG
jgi:hypothetical protein